MAMIKALLDRLPTLRSSQEFSSTAAELKDQLRVLEKDTEELRRQHRDALFAAPQKVDEIVAKISANQVDLQNLKEAIAGAEERQRQAAAAETAAQVEKRMRDAKKTQKELQESYIRLDEFFDSVTKEIGLIKKLEDELRSANDVARLHERRDLMVRSPWWHLGSIIGHHNYGNQHPSELEIKGYFPRRHPDGPALSRMKELKL